MEAQGQFMQVDMSSLCLERCRWWSPQCIKGEGNNERRQMSIQGNGVATHMFVFNILKHLMGVFVLLFWRLSTMTQCHPMSTSDPHVETAFSRQQYIVLKPEGLQAVYYVEWHWGCSITANTSTLHSHCLSNGLRRTFIRPYHFRRTQRTVHRKSIGVRWT